MRKALTAGGVLALPYVWLVAASAIYIRGKTDAWTLFRFPYLQWIEAARWWNYTPWVTLWVVLGALFPTLVLILLGIIAYRALRGEKPQDALYGTSALATPRELQQQNVQLKRRLF